MFRQNYSFVDEYRKEEMAEVKEKLQKLGKVAAQDKAIYERELKAKLHDLTDKQARAKQTASKLELKQQLKQANKARVEANKKPFYFKRSSVKQLLLANKLESFGSKDKIGQYMAQKHKLGEGKLQHMAQVLTDKKKRKLAQLSPPST